MAKLRAFLVEDSPMILERLSAALEEMADVRVVGSAPGEKEALAWFGSSTDGCDIAVIDLFLKSGSGLGVLEGMQAFAPPPERVVLTNYATPGHAFALQGPGCRKGVRQIHRTRGAGELVSSRVRRHKTKRGSTR